MNIVPCLRIQLGHEGCKQFGLIWRSSTAKPVRLYSSISVYLMGHAAASRSVELSEIAASVLTLSSAIIIAENLCQSRETTIDGHNPQTIGIEK